MESSRPECTAELLRHFADLRYGTHGDARSRRDKERLFTAAVALLDPHARRALEEINTDLLLGTGEVTAAGIRCRGNGLDAIWALSWPQQQAAAIKPVIIRAYYGVGAHHPHLQAGTAGDWPLNVFDEKQAAAELPTLRAAASADLHNLVFQRDYREIAPELADLVDKKVIRILDAVVVTKDTSGGVSAVEFDELKDQPGFLEIDAEVGGLIGPDDISFVGADLDPGVTAALLLVEDLWAAPLADALDRSGGLLLEGARIPRDLVDAAVAALQAAS